MARVFQIAVIIDTNCDELRQSVQQQLSAIPQPLTLITLDYLILLLTYWISWLFLLDIDQNSI